MMLFTCSAQDSSEPNLSQMDDNRDPLVTQLIAKAAERYYMDPAQIDHALCLVLQSEPTASLFRDQFKLSSVRWMDNICLFVVTTPKRKRLGVDPPHPSSSHSRDRER